MNPLSDKEVEQLWAAAAAVRVLVVGSLNIDLILESDEEPGNDGATLLRSVSRAVGGHAGNCAAAWAALGVSVGVAGCVGDDADGRLLRDDLVDRGIDVSAVVCVDGAPTGTAYIPNLGQRHFILLWRGANDRMTTANASSAMARDVDAVMLFDPSDEVLHDIGRLVAARAPRPLLVWTPGVNSGRAIVADVAPQADVLLLNRDEHRRVAARRLDLDPGRAGPAIVITLGESGSLLHERGREWAAAAPLATVVDPTGAGDAFAASFVLARLAGLSAVRCLELGNIAGALAVGAVGARGHLATLTELTQPGPRPAIVGRPR